MLEKGIKSYLIESQLKIALSEISEKKKEALSLVFLEDHRRIVSAKPKSIALGRPDNTLLRFIKCEI